MVILFDTSSIRINELSQIKSLILFFNCIKHFNESLIKTTYPTNIYLFFKNNLTFKEKFICTLLT